MDLAYRIQDGVFICSPWGWSSTETTIAGRAVRAEVPREVWEIDTTAPEGMVPAGYAVVEFAFGNGYVVELHFDREGGDWGDVSVMQRMQAGDCEEEDGEELLVTDELSDASPALLMALLIDVADRPPFEGGSA